ncbi:DUF3306 domain-containing protein [Yoonia litorea]|uniref:DUF3306 domain-containing protein n=1 Tax=Yoonia litorea TaxID=1123755 RepID=A0A1I6MWH7_9RHOB|nr:DUF3306 domain-containing protein [Yoonia litorea]SFS19961.1 Protein of unknown function [Yoonia litorea]
MTELSFWEQRKRGIAAEQTAEMQQRKEADARACENEFEHRSDADILAELGLPEPEGIETAEQVRAFLSHTLPQRLKVRALRKLWRLNPALANLDGLVDYGEDFTDSATVVENLQTAYQVGKGMLRDLLEDTPETDVQPTDTPDEETLDAVASSSSDTDSPPTVSDTVPIDPAFAAQEEATAFETPPRRFMRFSFEPETDRGAA